jgi:hypothetical protein
MNGLPRMAARSPEIAHWEKRKRMNIDVDLSWPVVRHKRFEIVVRMFDYQCDAWTNAIIYKDRNTQQRLGFVTNDGQHRVRPELVAEWTE